MIFYKKMGQPRTAGCCVDFYSFQYSGSLIVPFAAAFSGSKKQGKYFRTVQKHWEKNHSFPHDQLYQFIAPAFVVKQSFVLNIG